MMPSKVISFVYIYVLWFVWETEKQGPIYLSYIHGEHSDVFIYSNWPVISTALHHLTNLTFHILYIGKTISLW